MKKENIKYIILVCFFAFIFFLSPISGDDWANYLEGSQGIRHMIGNAIGMYFDWEGRFASRLLINFLTYYKFLWNIVNAIMVVGIIYYIEKIINPKNKIFIFLMSLLIILFMNIYTFSQVVVWLAGNITYLFITTIMLYYFYHMIRNKNCSKPQVVFFSFLNFIMPMFVEHMAVVLIIGNIFFLIEEYIKTKKINKRILIYLILSIFGFLLMLLSPGSMKRNEIENPEFNSLSFLGKLLHNTTNFIYYTYLINPYLLILMTLGNYYLLRVIRKKKWKVLVGVYIVLFPIIIFLLKNTINKESIIHIYYISYSIINLVLIYFYSCKIKDNRCLFFYILGMVANGVMLVSPTWGFRTSFATYVFLCLSYLLIIDNNIKQKKLLNIILLISCLLGTSYYSILYIGIFRQYNENLKGIINAKEEGKNIIRIAKYPDFVNCNINPENPFHLEKFKKYYKIDQSVEIRLEENKEDRIIRKIKKLNKKIESLSIR